MALGPDGVCGMHAAMYKFGINAHIVSDGGHGAHRDFDVSLGQAQIMGGWMCNCISFNVAFGIFFVLETADSGCTCCHNLRRHVYLLSGDSRILGHLLLTCVLAFSLQLVVSCKAYVSW